VRTDHSATSTGHQLSDGRTRSRFRRLIPFGTRVLATARTPPRGALPIEPALTTTGIWITTICSCRCASTEIFSGDGKDRSSDMGIPFQL
jgi:hypothetical protein